MQTTWLQNAYKFVKFTRKTFSTVCLHTADMMQKRSFMLFIANITTNGCTERILYFLLKRALVLRNAWLADTQTVQNQAPCTGTTGFPVVGKDHTSGCVVQDASSENEPVIYTRHCHAPAIAEVPSRMTHKQHTLSASHCQSSADCCTCHPHLLMCKPFMLPQILNTPPLQRLFLPDMCRKTTKQTKRHTSFGPSFLVCNHQFINILAAQGPDSS